jgi:DHA1 family inner membrane transport protein
MAFLRNDAINRVNLQSGVQALAQSGGGVFFVVYMVRTGVPVWAALTVLAGIHAVRFVLRPSILPLTRRWGIKPVLIAGALGQAVQYPVLAQVHGLNAWLAAVIGVAAVADILYWPTYNAYFASVGDPEHRGHQLGAREAMTSVAGILAPLIGGWALATFGPGRMFAVVGLVQALSVLPLIGAPNVPVAAEAPGAFRAARLGMGLFIADGWLGASYWLTWQVVLFLSLGQSLVGFGGAMALAQLAAAVAGLVLGRFIDQGGGSRAAVIAYVITIAVVIVRAFSLSSPWLAVAANTLGAFVGATVLPAMMSAVYNLAKASPCALRFHITSEGGWDIGCATASVIAAGIAAAGWSLAWALLLALPAAVASMVMLRRYYAQNPTALAPALPQLAAEAHPPP